MTTVCRDFNLDDDFDNLKDGVAKVYYRDSFDEENFDINDDYDDNYDYDDEEELSEDHRIEWEKFTRYSG